MLNEPMRFCNPRAHKTHVDYSVAFLLITAYHILCLVIHLHLPMLILVPLFQAASRVHPTSSGTLSVHNIPCVGGEGFVRG